MRVSLSNVYIEVRVNIHSIVPIDNLKFSGSLITSLSGCQARLYNRLTL